MKNPIRFTLLAAAFASVCALALTSCGDNSSRTSAKSDSDSDAAKPAAVSKGGSAADARASVQKQFDALTKGDLKSAFASLPASYQKDVSDIVKAAAAKLDAEVYKGVNEVLAAAADVGVAQAKLIAEMLSDGDKKADAEDIAAGAKAFKGFIEKLTLDALKKGDIPAILSAKEFADITKIAKEKIAPPKITGAEANDDGSVTLTIELDGAEDTVRYVKVEGAWVAEEMAEGWADGVKSARQSVRDFEFDAETKEQIMSIIPSLKSGLANLKKAKTKEEFQMGGIMLMMPLAPLLMGGGGGFGGDDDDGFDFYFDDED